MYLTILIYHLSSLFYPIIIICRSCLSITRRSSEPSFSLLLGVPGIHLIYLSLYLCARYPSIYLSLYLCCKNQPKIKGKNRLNRIYVIFWLPSSLNFFPGMIYTYIFPTIVTVSLYPRLPVGSFKALSPPLTIVKKTFDTPEVAKTLGQ